MDIRDEGVSDNVDSEKNTADLDHALSVAGLGIYNLKYCLVLALFLICAMVEMVGNSFILPAAVCDLDMSDSARGFISSIPYIGIVLTSFPWGYLVDTKGRKSMIIYSSIAAGIFGTLAGFMPDLITFTICKFLTSLCLACPAAVPYSFIGEILPPRHRDQILSITNAFQITASSIVPSLAWLILPNEFSLDFGLYNFRPWRLLTIVYALFFILAAILMSFGPESPKYLMSQGKHEEALTVIQNIYAGNKRKLPKEFPIQQLKFIAQKKEKNGFFKSLKVQSIPLLRPPYLKWMCLNGFLLFGIYSVLNGLVMWVPDVLNKVLTGDGTDLTACEVIGQRLNETAVTGECIDTLDSITFLIKIVSSLCCAIIAIAVSSTVKWIGKKRVLIFVYFLIGTFIALINVFTEDILFAASLSSIPIMGLGIGPINAYAVEIFPTNLRGMAVGLSMMLGRIGSVVGANLAGVLLNVACEATFYAFGGLLIFCGFLSLLLPNSKNKAKQQKNTDSVTKI